MAFNQLVLNRLSWTQFKSYVTTNDLSIQYLVDVDNNYFIFASNGITTITSTVPITSPANADQTDFETNFLPSANKRRELRTANVLSKAGVQGTLTVGTTPVEVKVGASRLADRKLVTLDNSSNSTIFWGWTNAVTTSTGQRILKGQNDATWSVNDEKSIWVVAASAGNIVRITESG